MKTLFVIIISLFSLSGFSQDKNFLDVPFLETNAKVDTMVSPDRIYLTILISEKDTKDKISVEEMENKMAKKLKSLGIDLDKQLTLSDLSSNFKTYFLKQQDVMKSKVFSLVVYDAPTAGKVIQGLEEIGISNVQLEKTEYSKMEALRLELRSKAVLQAKKQGESMLNPLGQKLGMAIHITDYNTQMYHYNGRSGVQMSMAKAEDSFEPIDVDFENIKVECELSVKFKID